MRDISRIKQQGAEIYYRDSVNGTYKYVKGKVIEYKTVEDAKTEWNQSWSRSYGTILKIEPCTSDNTRPKFRHLSSVLTPEQFKLREERRRSERKIYPYKQRNRSSQTSTKINKHGKDYRIS